MSFIRLRACTTGLLIVLAASVAPNARADAPPWCDASFNGGQSDVDAEKLLEARAKFAKCADPVCGKHLPDDCKEELAKVNRRVPSVTTAAFEGSKALSAYSVTVDGEPMPTDGTSMEVDPGKHVFVFTASDQRTKQIAVDVVESKRDQQVKAVFDAAQLPVTAPTPAAIASPSPSDSPAANATSPSRDSGARADAVSSRRTIGIITTVSGVVLVGVGGVLALSAKSKFNDARSNHCGVAVGGIDDSHCDAAGVEARNSAASTANVATVFWVLGGLAVVGGAVLWLTAPSEAKDARVSVGVGAGSLVVKGSF